MSVRFILLCFLPILGVSYCLVSVIYIFFVTSDCWNLEWGKTYWIQFTPVIVQSKRDWPLVWKLVEYSFNNLTNLCQDILYKRSKQTVNASHDQYKIPLCWNNLFQEKQILWIHQADYMQRNSLLIKILLKFNILCLHYVTHYCTWIECQPF